MAERIRFLRTKKGWTQDELAELLGMDRANISNYERGTITNIKNDVLKQMAETFNTSIDYIIGRTDDPSASGILSVPLSEKEQRDIARELERMMASLDSDSALAFDGEPLTAEDRELLRASLQHSLQTARIVAKQRFTPKKYRK